MKNKAKAAVGKYFIKTGLKNFEKFQVKLFCKSLFLIKLQACKLWHYQKNDCGTGSHLLNFVQTT